MTETIIHCDRCKARIAADRTWLENRCGPFVDARRSFDLCRSCFESLQSWIDTRPGVHASECRCQLCR
jgi:hypothetical protein